MGALAVAVLTGAQGEEGSQEGCIEALRALEALRVVAAYTEAGVPADDDPLCDPAGIEAVNSLWNPIQVGLGEDGWEQPTDDWRRR